MFMSRSKQEKQMLSSSKIGDVMIWVTQGFIPMSYIGVLNKIHLMHADFQINHFIAFTLNKFT